MRFSDLFDGKTPPARRHVSLPEQQFAIAALQRIAGHLGNRVGSLTAVIGPAGVGKTHLCHRLQRAVARQKILGPVVTCEALDLAAACLLAAEQQCPLAIRQALAGASIVICENLHEIARDADAQLVLVNLLDELTHAGQHVVVTSRQFPGRFSVATPRLVSRLHGGLLASISPLTEESAAQIQERSGAARPPTKTRSKKQVPARSPLDELLLTVAEEFGVTLEDLRSRSRENSIVLARQCAMYMAREVAKEPAELIGIALGNRLHATVTRGTRQFSTRLARSPALRNRLKLIRSRVEADRKNCG
jgi:chromosomal replication initiator protein